MSSFVVYPKSMGETLPIKAKNSDTKVNSGETVAAVSTGEFIEAGTPVKVVKYENTQLYVEKA